MVKANANLFIHVLQQWSPSVALLPTFFLCLLQWVSVSEVGLGVDIVEAGPGHHQLTIHQLYILQEGQTFLSLPPWNLLPLNTSPSWDGSCKGRKTNIKYWHRACEAHRRSGEFRTHLLHLGPAEAQSCPWREPPLWGEENLCPPSQVRAKPAKLHLKTRRPIRKAETEF